MNVNNLWERIQINYTIKIKKLCAQCKWKFFNTKKKLFKWKLFNANVKYTIKMEICQYK